MHISEPIPMSLKLQALQQAMSFNQELEDDVFNMAVQVLFKDEIHRFGGTDFLGWRHFLNQDFKVMSIIIVCLFYIIFYL